METLIRRRLIESAELVDALAKFADEPAIFYQQVPDDVQFGGSIQYPHIVFTIDRFANAQRGTIGTLTFEVVCSESETTPERIERLIQKALEGVFFTPEQSATFTTKWRETSLLEEPASERTPLIYGAIVNFEIFEYPTIRTAEPDIIAALNHYLHERFSNVVIIGESELPAFFEPTRLTPAVYFSRRQIRQREINNTDVWLRCTVMIHLFAPTLKARVEWLTELHYMLIFDGEITLNDGAPAFINDSVYDFAADENIGQIQLEIDYGILRKQKYAHTLMAAHFNEK